MTPSNQSWLDGAFATLLEMLHSWTARRKLPPANTARSRQSFLTSKSTKLLDESALV